MRKLNTIKSISAPILLLMLLGGCATAIFDKRACPPVKNYTKAQQAEFLKDLGNTPTSIQGAMVDYGKLRDKARACRAE